MATPLRILYIEDDDDDATLVSVYLRRSGFEPVIERVDTAAAMAAALAAGDWDLILSDFSLPAFAAPDALKILHASGQDLPFIIVSGTITEAMAVDALKAGAHDFIVKGNLARLVPAVERELRDAHSRQRRRRAEADLASERNLLRTLIDNIPDLIYAKDIDSRFTLANQASARSLGRTPEQVVGKTDFEFHPPELAAQFFADEQGIMRSGQPQLEHEEMVYIDGQERWLLTTTVPLHDTAGQTTGIVGISRDITQHRQSETALLRSQQQLQAVLDSVGEAIIVIDPSSRIVMANDEAARIWGYAAQSLAGMSLLNLMPEAYRARHTAGLQRYLDTGISRALGQRLEFEGLRQDGATFPLELSITETRLGSAQLFTGAVRDITQRKLRDRELQAVADISAALRTAQTLDEMLPVWLDVTLTLMQAAAGSIWLYDAGRDELRPAVTRGWVATGAPLLPQKPGVGVNGHVFVTGQPYVSADFKQDPHLAPGTRERIPPGGGVGIPIRVEDKVIGTFVVNLPPGRAVSHDDVHLLTTLAEIAGNAIHRTRLFQQTQQRVSQLSALRAIDLAITASMDLRVTLNIVMDHVLAQLAVDAADVLLLNPSDHMLTYTAGRGFRSPGVQQTRIRIGEGHAGRAVQSRQMIIANLHDGSPTSRRTDSLARDQFVSYVCVPLIAKGQVLGALELFHRTQLEATPAWLEFLSALTGQAAIAVDNAQLFESLARSNADLEIAYDATIEGWSRALDLRDRETEGHSQRVTALTERLALALNVSPDKLVHIRRGALLHDIGKMGVPDHILLKPGPLTDEEWAIMRQHPSLAYEMLAPIHYLAPALEIPYCHHEKWDGTGYPRGLEGEQIPLAARMFAVVDVWDALRSERPYRSAWPASKVLAHIESLAGTHFDPAVVQAFLQLELADKPRGA